MISKIFKKIHLKIQPHAVILLYHRVANLSSDPQLLSVNPELFRSHIEHLAEKYHPVSLLTLIDLINSGKKIPKGLVCITFDDGYADNLWNAKPILERYKVSATFFVTTGYIGLKREFWWDDLERIILLKDTLPDKLDLQIHGKQYNWVVEETQSNIKKPSALNQNKFNIEHPVNLEKWDVTQRNIPSQRHQLYCDLHKILKPLNFNERENILKKLCKWAEISEMGRSDYLALNCEEIKKLQAGGLVEIGSHSITHSELNINMEDLLNEEIRTSKEVLEHLLFKKIKSFSYPFGSRYDYSELAKKLVKSAGYTYACSNYPGCVMSHTDTYSLPRYLVRNWNKDQFEKNMHEWFNG